MSAGVLVVDDIPVNFGLLEAKLSAEYYAVIAVGSGAEALEIIQNRTPDIVFLNVMMPEMDGFEVCCRIKANPLTALLPVIMVAALIDQSDWVTGLETETDDFLTKPVCELVLFARLRPLLQEKLLLDELRLREKTPRQMNILRDFENRYELLHSKRVLLVGEDPSEGELIAEIFDENIHLDALSNSTGAIQKALKQKYNMASVSLRLIGSDSLRLCSQLRSKTATRYIPILVIVENSEPELVTKALELVAERIRDDLAGVPVKADIRSGSIDAAVSAGVAMRESLSESLDQHLKRADEALYAAKRGGRD